VKKKDVETKVGKRRVLTTWAVGEAWERFCRDRSVVIQRAFTAVGLGLPIDGCRDSELSLKGIEMEQFIQDMKDWRIGGVEQPTLDGENSDGGESLNSKDDNNESIDYLAGPSREEI
jgi:hypothetical protein